MFAARLRNTHGCNGVLEPGVRLLEPDVELLERIVELKIQKLENCDIRGKMQEKIVSDLSDGLEHDSKFNLDFCVNLFQCYF